MDNPETMNLLVAVTSKVAQDSLPEKQF